MTDTVSALDLPFDKAIQFFRSKANVTPKKWAALRAEARAQSFTVSGAASEALLQDIRQEIEKALEAGTTLEEFRASFDDIVQRHGWDYTGKRNWRTNIIFDTNLRGAYAAGRYAQLTEPETLEAFPYWQYHHSGSLHPREQHLAWDGTVLRADDPFWITNYPPNGFRCGCYVTPVSETGLRRQGKFSPDRSPVLDFKAVEVKGETVWVPDGVDPGFDNNPGLIWQKGAVQ